MLEVWDPGGSGRITSPAEPKKKDLEENRGC